MTLSALIPRALYPEKPDVTKYVQHLAYQAGLYTDSTYYAERRGAIAIDAVSEFYINFGPLGVFLLAILHGMYLRMRYDWLIGRSNFDFGFPIYAVGFLSFTTFWNMFVLDIKNWVVWGLLLRLCSRRVTRVS